MRFARTPTQAAADKEETHAVPGRLILEQMPGHATMDKNALVRTVPKHLQVLKRSNTLQNMEGSFARKNVNTQELSSWQSEGQDESPLGSPRRDPGLPWSPRRAAHPARDAEQKKQAEALLALQQGQEAILAALKDMTSSLRALEDRVVAGQGVSDGQGAWEDYSRAKGGGSSGGEDDEGQLRKREDSDTGGQDEQAPDSNQLAAMAHFEQAWDKAADLRSDSLAARQRIATSPVRAEQHLFVSSVFASRSAFRSCLTPFALNLRAIRSTNTPNYPQEAGA